MPPLVNEIFGFLGFLVRFLGFLIAGYGIGRFVLDSYKTGEWQVQIALALGFFGLLIALTVYSTPGSSGAFALGTGVALLYAVLPRKAASGKEN